MQARVSNLKQQLEHLFPGKWLRGDERARNLSTGLPEIDKGIARGIARRRISEWSGATSSGKTSLLRTAISNWCNAGLNVAYIDSEGRLLASDWAFVEHSSSGKFWIVRPPDENTLSAQKKAAVKTADNTVPLISKKVLFMQEALWSADQFVRSRAFDVVILDLGSSNPASNKRQGLAYNAVPSKIYARLQRSLDRSNCALIIVRDTASDAANEGWGCHARFNFNWGASIKCEAGLAGTAMITPTIKCQVTRDGMSEIVEVNVGSKVQNRLFTHPQVPDRRTSKR